MIFSLDPFIRFWTANPALWLGLFVLSGCSIALTGNFSPLFIPLLLIATTLRLTRTMLTFSIAGTLFFTAALLSTWTRIPSHPVEGTSYEGVSYFSPKSIVDYSSPFSSSTCIKGTLVHFDQEGKTLFKNLPCTLFGKKLPQGDVIVLGKITKASDFSVSLKPSQFIEVENTKNLALSRYHAKKKIGSFIASRVRHEASAHFLTGLLTGQTNDQSLSYDLSKLGLSHLLAISGFHFGLISYLIYTLLKFLIRPKGAAIGTLLLLTLYFLLIGPSPSVQRAWIAATIYLSGILLSRRPSALNTLGIALLIELALQPLTLFNLGFQFSYLATAGILLLMKPIEKLLSPLLPARKVQEVIPMSTLDKHIFLASQLLRKTFALNLSVVLFLLPAQLYHFHYFPLLSLLYNLFVPSIVALLMPLLLLAFVVPPLFALTSLCTSALLAIIHYAPTRLNFLLESAHFPLSILAIFITFLSLWAIYSNHKKESSQLIFN